MRQLRFLLLGLTAAVLLAVALILATACGTDDEERERTGLSEVDTTIDAVLSQDIDTLAGLVIYHQEKCSTGEVPEIPIPPRCSAGQPEGSLVDALSYGACKPGHVAREEVAGFLAERLETELQLYAVYRTESTEELGTDYTIIFSAPSGPGDRDSVALDMAGGRIASLATPCTSFADLAEMLENEGAEAILPPPRSGD